jgi:cytochrome c oxidase subunit 2
MFINIFTTVMADAAYPWQYGFQDSASPTHEGIIILHDSICFYLVLISFLVFWVLGSILVNFHSERQAIVHKYQTHGTLIELIWTITPALILVAIAFPSFKLLYLIGHFSDKDLFNIIAVR